MKPTIQKAKIPALRFPEFEGEWVLNVFSDLVNVIDCKHRTPPYVEEGIPVISPGSINWGELDLITPNKRVAPEEYESLMDHCSPEIGDLVFSRNQSIGIASILYKKEKFVLGQDTVLIQAKKVDPFFIYFVIQTHLIQTLISKLSGGSTFSRINLKDVRELKMYVSTSRVEQKKIGSFLIAVDKKLQALKKKKSLLEQYKKGVMQKIFSQELRLKDEQGNDFPEWEEKQLAEILKEHKTRNAKGKIEEVFSVAKEKGVINQIEHLGRSYASKDTSNYKVVYPGDVIYTKSPTSDFPFGIIKQNKLNRTGIVSVLYGVFSPTNQYLGLFLDYYFSNWKNTYNYLNPLVQKGAKNTMNIGNNDFLNGAEISLPSSEQELIKIAYFLSALDKKINHCQAQIDKTERYKKGLLQQMFV
ncbi:restriction endonuclease subunit S [Adhaeribacter soli]|uniref:Type I restriction modification DNA specificity domain-containing protein n=1 Tax=Adhaeribacter soli TaxID=2607655 RepID=A0A5N1J0A6_9BACT|nr:restriction endonuclease subunit S [Adhaeribacter soli]KAA9340135.1 hypothetical protein F0P94_07240 [Adhaeribacter soli]